MQKLTTVELCFHKNNDGAIRWNVSKLDSDAISGWISEIKNFYIPVCDHTMYLQNFTAVT